jgi:serine/threonine protein kinase
MPQRSGSAVKIARFDLPAGRLLARKYEVLTCLGGGWEGEVYLVRESSTGIERTAKLFYPHRNRGDRAARFHARKLHKLRHCPILIQYYTRETVTIRRTPITALVSEYVEGELLSRFLERQPGRRLQPFPAIHLLHALASGIERIHRMREYHGDLHTDNVIVQRFGLGFDLKLVDMFQWGAPTARHIQDDVLDLVRIFYDALGGPRRYAQHPPEVKEICCGLKRTLILRKFATAGQLRDHLERLEWSR